LDASLDVSVDVGLTGRHRDEVATGLALMERDAMDVDLFALSADQGAWTDEAYGFPAFEPRRR
jgi:hypothetical protein